mmetsp:Transcript_16144/g.43463  ORF Transcript_16144/g.43463 Transcript_16144/m.43463 type:complete len:260 (-) Transcript_16144:1102-1881(-)
MSRRPSSTVPRACALWWVSWRSLLRTSPSLLSRRRPRRGTAARASGLKCHWHSVLKPLRISLQSSRRFAGSSSTCSCGRSVRRAPTRPRSLTALWTLSPRPSRRSVQTPRSSRATRHGLKCRASRCRCAEGQSVSCSGSPPSTTRSMRCTPCSSPRSSWATPACSSCLPLEGWCTSSPLQPSLRRCPAAWSILSPGQAARPCRPSCRLASWTCSASSAAPAPWTRSSASTPSRIASRCSRSSRARTWASCCLTPTWMQQ